MADTNQQPAQPAQRRTNGALWLGLLIFVLGLFSQALYWLKVPAAIVPWINLAVPAIGLIFLLVGVTRAFRQPQLYRGKIWGTLVTALAALLVAGTIWLFFIARDVPRSAGAPQLGQRVPDFSLPDSNGQSVSLAQLFSGASGAAQPKAVLLVFYRGYW